VKLTKAAVKEFENDQKQWGTMTALSNFIFNVARELLRDIGVRNIAVAYYRGGRGRR